MNNLYRLLTFWVHRPKVKVKLLSNASGFVKPGMLVALLGPPVRQHLLPVWVPAEASQC